jgi:hypothetical protein
MIRLDVGFREEFEFLAYEFNTLPMRAVDHHHIRLYFLLIAIVNLIQKVIDDGPLP